MTWLIFQTKIKRARKNNSKVFLLKLQFIKILIKNHQMVSNVLLKKLKTVKLLFVS